ncbi:MAG: hypothetical protein SF182_25345 [Deltaproteobacteria bacterium]|nr:hypothetical protein [Deltaproteobacteria bacterium]
MRLLLPLLAALSFDPAPIAAATCSGDCGGDGVVTVNELVRAVSIALGSTAVGECSAADANGDGQVTVAELVGAVNSVLQGCGGSLATPTPTPTGAPNLTPTSSNPACDNGEVTFTYSNVANTNAVTTDLTLRLVAAGEVRDTRTGLYIWNVTALECLEGVQFHRSISIQFIGVNSPMTAGASAEVKAAGFPLSTIVYGELQDPNVFQRTWSPQSGTMTVEAADGDQLRFRFVADMRPLPLASFGAQPTGTFSLDVRGTIKRVIR